jgi:soluble lytic murein transglycosylase-like protein
VSLLLAMLLTATPSENFIQEELSKKMDGLTAAVLSQTIHEESISRGLDPLFVLAVMKVESSLNPSAVSPVGARGLMQIMPQTEKWILEALLPNFSSHYISWDEPVSNAKLGIAYLAYLMKRYGRNKVYALVAYNSGPSRLDADIKSNENITPGRMSYVELVKRQYVELVKGIENERVQRVQ